MFKMSARLLAPVAVIMIASSCVASERASGPGADGVPVVVAACAEDHPDCEDTLATGGLPTGGNDPLAPPTQPDDGDLVSLATGAEIQVTLEGNATTGFSWELVEYDPAVIAPLGEPIYNVDDGELVGTGGSWTWTLQAVAAGESPVRFVYHRTWEDEPPESTFSFTAAVDQ